MISRFELARGMTFVEVVLVITVLGATTFITVPMIETAIESWSFVAFRSELWQTGEMAMSRMVQDIREIKGISDVRTANSRTFRFRTISNEDVTYSYSGSSIVRTVTSFFVKRDYLLLSDVNAFAFTYFDAAGNKIANPRVWPLSTNIRRVRIYFVLGPTGRTFVLQTDVKPRNIH